MSLAALILAGAQAIALPACEVQADEGPVDCVTRTGDAIGWTLALDYDPHEGPQRLTVRVLGGDGGPVQRLDVALDGSFLPARLEDLNGDDLDDLVVPVSGGLANLDWALFFGDWTGFEGAASRVNGHTVEPAREGEFAVHARSHAARHDVTFYRWDGAQLTTAAIVAIEFGETGATCRRIAGDEGRADGFYCGQALAAPEDREED